MRLSVETGLQDRLVQLPAIEHEAPAEVPEAAGVQIRQPTPLAPGPEVAPKPEPAGARDTDRAMDVEVIRFRRKRPIDPSNPLRPQW